MQNTKGTPSVPVAAMLIAGDMIPTTDAAVAATVSAARTVAGLVEQSARFRGAQEGCALPIKFAEKPIDLAYRTLIAANELRLLSYDTRIASAALLGELGFGSQCKKYDVDQDIDAETSVRLAAAAFDVERARPEAPVA